jgi:ubiquinone/menaquinone biosynthesis C-methylase UbiE
VEHAARDQDRWSRWLLDRRHGGDERQLEATLEHLAGVRERVLAMAEPLDGATVLDVGSGDGLLGLGALERVGPHGRVIFSDVSAPLLEQARRAVAERGALERARFVLSRAEELAEIADASVDALTTRSVLIYVADKAAAFAAMRRVLAPGGRIALFEPINRLMFPEPPDRFWGYRIDAAVVALADRVKAAFAAGEQPAAGTMTDFDDRDLARLAEEAGFDRVHLECHIDVEPGSLARATSLDALLDSAPNPLAPTIREAIEAALDPRERERLLAELGGAIAAGDAIRRSAVAYLSARTAR